MAHPIRPNLFVIGAMKSGTSTLHALLAEHPDVFMSEPKEPCYFVDAAHVGESSTNCSKLPRITDVAGRIARFWPHGRLIYITRGPVQRTISDYCHMVEHRHKRRPALKALKEDAHYTDLGYYDQQLWPYHEPEWRTLYAS